MIAIPRTPLKVVIDTDTVSAADPQARFLFGLLRRSSIAAYWYADDGPPPDKLQHDPVTGVHYGVDGWLFYSPGELDDWDGSGSVAYSDEPPSWRSIVLFPNEHVMDMAAQIATSHGLDSAGYRDVRGDLELPRIADAANAHLLITQRPHLLDAESLSVPPEQCPALPVTDALTLLGLWLRMNGSYVVWAGHNGGTHLTGRSTFYDMVSHTLLPSSWRWQQACVHSDKAALHPLGTSLIRRVATALKHRDRALSAGWLMEAAAARDEVRDCVDAVALYLVGALDTAARAAHHSLSITDNVTRAAWQRADFRKHLPPKLRETARYHLTSMRILINVRNTIHSSVMHLRVLHNPLPDESDYYLALPPSEQDALREWMMATGGLTAWGVREVHGELWADPFALIDQMLIQGVTALDDFLRDTPVETHVPAEVSLEDVPPAADHLWRSASLSHLGWQFGPRISRRIEQASRQAPAPTWIP